jgi:hypothetical protein
MKLSYNSAILLPGLSPNELKTHIQTNPCTGMVIAAVFTLATPNGWIDEQIPVRSYNGM